MATPAVQDGSRSRDDDLKDRALMRELNDGNRREPARDATYACTTCIIGKEPEARSWFGGPSAARSDRHLGW
jgi:hypothetical protein